MLANNNLGCMNYISTNLFHLKLATITGKSGLSIVAYNTILSPVASVVLVDCNNTLCNFSHMISADTQTHRQTDRQTNTKKHEQFLDQPVEYFTCTRLLVIKT